MNVKTLTQIFLILAIISITLFFFYKYFYQTNNPIELVEKETVKEQNLIEEKIDNIKEDLTFENIGLDGNTFKIDSKYGEFSIDNEGNPSLNSIFCRSSRAEKSRRSELERESSLSVCFFQTDENFHEPIIESNSIPLPDFFAKVSSARSSSKLGDFSYLSSLELKLLRSPKENSLLIFFP